MINSQGNRLKRKDRYRSVFRGKSSQKSKSIFRLSLEAFIMISTGVYIVLFVNSLSSKIDWSPLLQKSLDKLVQSFLELVTSLSVFLGIISIFLLTLFGIVLILGAFGRSLKLITAVNQKSSRRSTSSKT